MAILVNSQIEMPSLSIKKVVKQLSQSQKINRSTLGAISKNLLN